MRFEANNVSINKMWEVSTSDRALVSVHYFKMFIVISYA